MLGAYKLVKELNFERTAGSEEEKKGREIIVKNLKQLGFSPAFETFKLYCYTPGKAEITVGNKKFLAYPFGLTESTKIEAELVFLENPEVLMYNSQSYERKVIIGYRYSRKIGEALRKSKAAAFITIGQPFKKATTKSYRQKTYKEGYVPSLCVSFDDGAKLSRKKGKK